MRFRRDAGGGTRAVHPHTRRREHESERRPFSGLAGDVEFATVALDHVLNDRQAEAGAARLARAAAIDAVETLGQAREMFACDAPSRVLNFHLAGTVLELRPSHVDAPAVGRIAHGVADEVGNGALQLAFRTRDLGMAR